jgi:hypothetical protein
VIRWRSVPPGASGRRAIDSRREHVRARRAGGSVLTSSGCVAGRVELPDALAQKYSNAGREWGWQWVFPATRFYFDRETGQRQRHHLHESVHPARRARGPASLGYRQAREAPPPFATRSRRTCWRTATTSGPFRTCWGTAMIYTHVLNRGPRRCAARPTGCWGRRRRSRGSEGGRAGAPDCAARRCRPIRRTEGRD